MAIPAHTPDRWLRALTGLAALWASCALGASLTPKTQQAGGVSGSLHEIRVLAAAGAPELALSRLNRLAPQNRLDPAWTSWARERIRLLERTDQWPAIVSGVANLPPGLPPEFVAWAESRDVRALIALHDFRTARALLRNWIWLDPSALSQRRRMELRKEIIAVYLASGDLADGETALERYRDSYPSGQTQFTHREARLLIETRHVRTALWMLAADRSPRARILVLKARLIGGLSSPRTVARAATTLGADRHLDPELRVEAEQVAWQAWENQNRWHEALGRLKRIVALANARRAHLALPRELADELWQTLLSEGTALANRAGLVRGLAGPWFKLASGISGDHPWRALALLAVVAHGSFSSEDQGEADLRMMHLLSRLPDGSNLLLFLFLDPRAVPHLARLPESLRDQLLDPLLATGHLRLAARLVRGLVTPPAGMSPKSWMLKRIEINLYGGQVPRALRELKSDLDRCSSCPEGGSWLALAFDLEHLHLDLPALALLETLAHNAHRAQRRRQLFYWLGEDESRLGHWRRAAWDYLWSAAMLSPFAMDPWAQSARFKAARALTHAGLDRDALRQYEGLFNAASTTSQKAFIAAKIRALKLQLALRAQARTGPGHG